MTTNDMPECPPGARLIELRRRTGPSLWTIVDEADYEDLSRFRWSATFLGGSYSRPYAARAVSRPGSQPTTELMHRHLIPGVELVDHINGNGLDNRRANLRAATKVENGRNRRSAQRNNSSGFLGVDYDRTASAWRARVVVWVGGARVRRTVGRFTTPAAAAIARDLACLEVDPVYYTLNFPGLRRSLPIVPR